MEYKIKMIFFNFLLNAYFTVAVTGVFALDYFQKLNEKSYNEHDNKRIEKVVNYFDYDKNGDLDSPEGKNELLKIMRIYDWNFVFPEYMKEFELKAYDILVKERKIKPVDYENKN